MPSSAVKRSVPWKDIDKDITGLATDTKYEIEVTREAIPIVFVPGIMGSRLQRKGAIPRDERDLPRVRWDPGARFMLTNYFGRYGARRKRMLIGPRFSSDFLEVISRGPDSDGFEGIMAQYHERFLVPRLRNEGWGPLEKYFDLPVYACGYNWTDQVENAGQALADRIAQIKKDAAKITGVCEKVIVVTHSMGGLVSRWASEKAGAAASILGIIHGVQPVTGSTAAYWRIKGGFEEGANPIETMTNSALGNSGDVVTPVLGNMPGGLSLLPNKLHRANDGTTKQWLTITGNGAEPRALPNEDPYEEIYRVPAVINPVDDASPSNNDYWGLVDPDLLDPGNTFGGAESGSNDDLALQLTDPWSQYIKVLKMAETFHEKLGTAHHEKTFCSQGIGRLSPNVIELRIEEKPWHTFRSYPNHGFRGFFRDAAGNKMMAVLQPHTGREGDGTVPRFSSGRLNEFCTLDPKPVQEDVDHQGAYEQDPIATFTRRAIVSLCEQHFKAKHG